MEVKEKTTSKRPLKLLVWEALDLCVIHPNREHGRNKEEKRMKLILDTLSLRDPWYF